MKLTVNQILNGFTSLQTLSETELPVRAAFLVGRNLRALNVELKTYQETLNKGDYTSADELLTIEVDVDITPIPVEMLGDTSLQPGLFVWADWMFTENGHES